MNSIKHLTLLLTSVLTAGTFSSCDDGYVNDPTYTDTTESYTVKVTGTFEKASTWEGDYSVVIACFDDESNYSIIQKVLPSHTTDSTEVEVTISKVPTSAKTVELAVVGKLRNRVATLYSVDIPEDLHSNDTLHIDMGTRNVGMFGTINKALFQNTSVNCARCHSTARAAANLDLSEQNAYTSLVNTPAHKNPQMLRVKPEDAESSYLYKVITEGAEEVGYNHPALLADHHSLIDIIKSWINSGAKE